ncbi:hypothetical protein RJ639_003730, partial [Escallonia herrerae]
MAEVMCLCGKRSKIVTSWTYANPGRRFLSCSDFVVNGGCGYFAWLDPPTCNRSRALIPGLLRNMKKLKMNLATVRKREK